jgi:hypothetical protein
VNVSEPIGFIITATNGSDLPMTGATYRHELPDGFAWELVSEIEGCAITEGVLECTLASLNPGESIAFGITAPTSVEEYCVDLLNVVTLGTPGSEDMATVTIHCDGTGATPLPETGTSPEDGGQQKRDAVTITQLPKTGTGPGSGMTGDPWLLALVSRMLFEGGVIALLGRKR